MHIERGRLSPSAGRCLPRASAADPRGLPGAQPQVLRFPCLATADPACRRQRSPLQQTARWCSAASHTANRESVALARSRGAPTPPPPAPCACRRARGMEHRAMCRLRRAQMSDTLAIRGPRSRLTRHLQRARSERDAPARAENSAEPRLLAIPSHDCQTPAIATDTAARQRDIEHAGAARAHGRIRGNTVSQRSEGRGHRPGPFPPCLCCDGQSTDARMHADHRAFQEGVVAEIITGHGSANRVRNAAHDRGVTHIAHDALDLGTPTRCAERAVEGDEPRHAVIAEPDTQTDPSIEGAPESHTRAERAGVTPSTRLTCRMSLRPPARIRVLGRPSRTRPPSSRVASCCSRSTSNSVDGAPSSCTPIGPSQVPPGMA